MARTLGPAMREQLLTLHDLASHLQVSDKTVLRLLAEDPDFPRPITVRRQARWMPEEVRDWERLLRARQRVAARGGTNPDTAGQSGTSAPPNDLPARRRKDTS